ncbi:MAG: ATP-binding protein [Micrococcales bacterium]|nr:ATP-binding protein [Micrococcales bacterium]
MRAVRRYLETVNMQALEETAEYRSPLGELLSEHLGTDAGACSVVDEQLPDHRLVDADLALEELRAASDGRLIGVTGGNQRDHIGLAELVSAQYVRIAPGPVDYVVRATGPTTTRRVVSFGVWLLRHEGRPLAVLQRAASPHTGRAQAALEVLGADPDAVSDFLDRVRELMIARSVLRGQVLSFVATEYGADAGATLLPRSAVAASDIVLAPGVLGSIVDHVVGIGEHRDALLAAGRHLKRGILLYGPPGTGKTLTVRHLLSQTEGTTAVLLTGASIRFISAAAEIARTFPPALVVLEDIDLVAMERHSSPQPLLFEVLDALDGLEGDADIAFVMTTNRVEVLERALADRPGRVDLAVELPRPAPAERRTLFERYALGLPFSRDALHAAADQAEGTTGSFAKELMRDAVLRAAVENRAPTDADLADALETLRDSRNALTRRLLGARTEPSPEDLDDGSSAGWTAYVP